MTRVYGYPGGSDRFSCHTQIAQARLDRRALHVAQAIQVAGEHGRGLRLVLSSLKSPPVRKRLSDDQADRGGRTLRRAEKSRLALLWIICALSAFASLFSLGRLRAASLDRRALTLG